MQIQPFTMVARSSRGDLRVLTSDQLGDNSQWEGVMWFVPPDIKKSASMLLDVDQALKDHAQGKRSMLEFVDDPKSDPSLEFIDVMFMGKDDSGAPIFLELWERKGVAA